MKCFFLETHPYPCHYFVLHPFAQIYKVGAVSPYPHDRIGVFIRLRRSFEESSITHAIELDVIDARESATSILPIMTILRKA